MGSDAGWSDRLRSLDLLKIAAGLIAAAGLLLHLVGSVWHESYLRAWGINAAAFPKSTDWHLIAGYEAVLSRSLKVLSLTAAELLQVVGVALAIAAYWTLLRIDLTKKRAELPPWAQRIPAWLRSGIARFAFVALLSGLVFLSTVLLSVILAVPVLLGNLEGREHAMKEMNAWRGGCGSAGANCFELKRGSDHWRGFLIDSSPENIAFFDVDARRSRAMSRTGTEILGEDVDKLLSNAASSAATPSSSARGR